MGKRPSVLFSPGSIHVTRPWAHVCGQLCTHPCSAPTSHGPHPSHAWHLGHVCPWHTLTALVGPTHRTGSRSWRWTVAIRAGDSSLGVRSMAGRGQGYPGWACSPGPVDFSSSGGAQWADVKCELFPWKIGQLTLWTTG